MNIQIINADVLDGLASLPNNSVDCCITSPPYWGLRDYGNEGQIGLEKTPEEYVAKLVQVFHEVRRVLKPQGTLWLNLGDSYNGSGKGAWDRTDVQKEVYVPPVGTPVSDAPGLKPKDLVGIPWRVAFALQADGWYLRQDIIWHKPNPMPESVTDRCTKAHEYVFLFAKNKKYYFDNEAIKEPSIYSGRIVKATGSLSKNANAGVGNDTKIGFTTHDKLVGENRNRRSVWTITTKPYKGAHFATFPTDLIEPMVKAGCPEQVCAKCGQPRERVARVVGKQVTDAMRVAGCNADGEYHGEATKEYGNVQNPSDTKRRILESMSQVKEFAWSECGCGVGFNPGVVLDPFAGSGTTLAVAKSLGRSAVGIELNPEYIPLIKERVAWGQQGIEPVEYVEARKDGK